MDGDRGQGSPGGHTSEVRAQVRDPGISLLRLSANLCDGNTEGFSCCNQHQISTWM